MVRVIRTRDLGREALGCLDVNVDGHVYTDMPEYREQQWLLERERKDKQVQYEVVQEDYESASEVEFGDSLTEEWDNAESDSSSRVGSNDESGRDVDGDSYSFYEEACQESDEDEGGIDWGIILD